MNYSVKLSEHSQKPLYLVLNSCNMPVLSCGSEINAKLVACILDQDASGYEIFDAKFLNGYFYPDGWSFRSRSYGD